jgi:hypothetical protein
MTRNPGRLVSVSIARHSRVYSSIYRQYAERAALR